MPLAATGHLTGATPTTSGPGTTAAGPISTTWSSCAAATTAPSTRASGGSMHWGAADSASNSTAAHPAKTTRSLSGRRHRRIPRYRPRRRRSATTAATEATISPTSMPIRPVPIATSPTSYPPLPSTAHRTPASAPSRAPLTNHRAVFGRLSPDMRPSHSVGQGLQRPLLVLPPQSTDQPLKGLPADPWRSRTPRTARDRAVPASAVPARTRAARRDGARR